jgi:Ca2+-binding EF-hand superfamily protein
MSTTSGVNSSGNIWAALNTQRSRQQTKLFAKVDTDGSGQLSQTEFEAGGAPPAGGPGGAGGAKGASSSDTTFAPLDSNQDGVVSEVERMVGLRKSDGNTDIANAADQ